MMKVETHGDTIRSSQERISFDDSKEVHPILTDLFTDRSQVPEGSVQVREVLSHLQKNGLRPMTDPRLGEFMRQMSVEPGHPGHADHVEVRKQVSVEEFQAAGRSCPGLLNRALSCSLAIPDFKEFCAQIKSIYEELRHVKGGKNAQYIPQLARVNPDYWGVSVCTVDGQRFSIGDVNVPFCIQSCSKALNYAINVTEHGAEYVHQFLGKEPSGRGFNQIHLDKNGLPHNPMINPGAISCCSVLRKEDSLADRFLNISCLMIAIFLCDHVTRNLIDYWLKPCHVTDKNYMIKANMSPDTSTRRRCTRKWREESLSVSAMLHSSRRRVKRTGTLLSGTT